MQTPQHKVSFRSNDDIAALAVIQSKGPLLPAFVRLCGSAPETHCETLSAMHFSEVTAILQEKAPLPFSCEPHGAPNETANHEERPLRSTLLGISGFSEGKNICLG